MYVRTYVVLHSQAFYTLPLLHNRLISWQSRDSDRQRRAHEFVYVRKYLCVALYSSLQGLPPANPPALPPVSVCMFVSCLHSILLIQAHYICSISDFSDLGSATCMLFFPIVFTNLWCNDRYRCT